MVKLAYIYIYKPSDHPHVKMHGGRRVMFLLKTLNPVVSILSGEARMACPPPPISLPWLTPLQLPWPAPWS